MRFPGTRSSTASTILEQSGQVDQRKADRKRARTARNQQVLGGIGAGLDVLKLAPQFTKIASDQQEGERERAFAAAMEIAQGKSREALQANQLRFGREQIDREENLERELAPLKYAQSARQPETALERAMAEVQAARVAGEIRDIETDPNYPAASKQAAIQGRLTGQITPQDREYEQRKVFEAPVRQAAGRAGIVDTDLAAKLDPGAYSGMDRDDFLALVANIAIEGGENSPAIAKVLQAAGGKVPERTPIQKFGRGVSSAVKDFLMQPEARSALFGGPDPAPGAEEEILQLIQAIQAQNTPPSMTGTPTWFAPPKPLSPATRKFYIGGRKKPTE